MTRTEFSFFCLVILAGIAVRVWNIDHTIMDRQAWRQCDTAAIARNFYRGGFHILYPETDWYTLSGRVSGYTETEFPLVSFLAAFMYLFFGEHAWAARLVSVMFALGSMICLFRLVQLHFDSRSALFAMLFFAVSPMSVFYTQTIQPESAMIFFSIGTVLFLSMWYRSGRLTFWIIAAGFIALAILVKVLTAYMLLPVAYLLFLKKKWRLFRSRELYIVILVCIVPAILWHVHAHRLFLVSEKSFFRPVTGDYRSTTDIFRDIWERRWVLQTAGFWIKIGSEIIMIVLTPVGAAVLLYSLVVGRLEQERKVFYAWLIAVLVFIVFNGPINVIHPYYQLPIAPVAAVFIGIGMSRLSRLPTINDHRRSGMRTCGVPALMVAALLVMSFYEYRRQNYHEVKYPAIIAAAADVQTYTGRNSLLIVGTDITYPLHRPEILYLSDRKGWPLKRSDIRVPVIRRLIERGARYFVTADPVVLTVERPVVYRYLVENHRVIVKTRDHLLVELDGSCGRGGGE